MRFPDIKVGDQVIIDGEVIARVERVTNTQFTANGRRISRSFGRQIGGTEWRCLTAKPATPELIEKVEKRIEKNLVYNNVNRLFNQLTTLFRSISRDETPGDIAAAIPHLEAALAAMRGDTPTTTTEPHA